MSFRPATLQGQSITPARELPLADSEDFEPGALLLVSSGEFAECGADPSAVAAVAVTGAGPDAEGFRLPARKEFPPNRIQGIIIQEGQRFSAEYVGTLGSIGTAYGVVKDSDNNWKVDFTDTTNDVVTLVDIDGTAAPLSHPRVIVTFLPAVIQAV